MRRWCFRWHGRYFCIALLLSFIEVLIALYVHDAWIRPIFGDVLIVFVFVLYSYQEDRNHNKSIDAGDCKMVGYFPVLCK